jgi:hypothetical protein
MSDKDRETAFIPPRSGTWNTTAFDINSDLDDNQDKKQTEELSPTKHNSPVSKKKSLSERFRASFSIYPDNSSILARENELNNGIVKLNNDIVKHHPADKIRITLMKEKVKDKLDKLNKLHDKYFDKIGDKYYIKARGGSKTKKHRKKTKTHRMKSKKSKKTVSKKKR